MKKWKTMVPAIVAMVAPVLFASCDSDPWYEDRWYEDWRWGNDYNHRPDNGNVGNEDFFVSMAQTLAGQWRGGMTAYQLDAAGKAIDSLRYVTDIEFKQYNDQSVSGTGTQYDFEPATEQLQLQRDFTWYIDTSNGDIFINYKELQSDGTLSSYVMKIAYDDLNLDNRTFTGYLWANDGYEVDDFLFNRYTGTRASGKTGAVKIKMVMN